MNTTASMQASVEVAHEVTDEVVDALAHLLPQLSKSAPALTKDAVAAIIETSATTLFLARDENNTIIGSLTLVTFLIPSGKRAIIEDVVVDESRRGYGTGAALVTAALNAAQQQGIRSVDLTSRPNREAANRLYVRMGFEQRTTNVYRYSMAN
jgi:ribosomal protein S18 acetylase RimI-like enzyme